MTPPPKDTAPSAAGTIAALIKAHAGAELPVRLRLWDGSEAGPDKSAVLVVRSPQALRRILWRPGELGLARAYVSGDLDLDGDLTEGLRLVRHALSPNGNTQPARTTRARTVLILTRGTGQRLTDRRMAATRPRYADYAARTSGFIPLPPRRPAAPR